MSETFNWHKEAERQWDSRSDMWGAKSRMMWEEGSRSSIIPFVKKHMAARRHRGLWLWRRVWFLFVISGRL